MAIRNIRLLNLAGMTLGMTWDDGDFRTRAVTASVPTGSQGEFVVKTESGDTLMEGIFGPGDHSRSIPTPRRLPVLLDEEGNGHVEGLWVSLRTM